MGKLYAKASMHKTRSRPEEKPILLPACLAIKSVCLFLFLGFCVVFIVNEERPPVIELRAVE